LKPVSLLEASVQVKVVVCWKLGKRSSGLVNVTHCLVMSRLVGAAGKRTSGTTGISTTPEFELPESDEFEFESLESFEFEFELSEDCATAGGGGAAISGRTLVSPMVVAYCPHSQHVPPMGMLMIQ